MRYKLISVDGMHIFELRDGARLIVGRAPSSDVPIIDPTISRRHAELQSAESGFSIRAEISNRETGFSRAPIG